MIEYKNYKEEKTCRVNAFIFSRPSPVEFEEMCRITNSTKLNSHKKEYYESIDINKYFKNNDIRSICFILLNNAAHRNNRELINKFKQINTNYAIIRHLITNHICFKTIDMIKYYFDLNPDDFDILYFMHNMRNNEDIKIKSYITKRFKNMITIN